MKIMYTKIFPIVIILLFSITSCSSPSFECKTINGIRIILNRKATKPKLNVTLNLVKT